MDQISLGYDSCTLARENTSYPLPLPLEPSGCSCVVWLRATYNSLYRSVVSRFDEIAYLLIPLDVDGVIGDCFGYPKIDDLQSPLNQDKVGRLEICMYDVLLMYRLYGLQHLWSVQGSGSY